MYQVHAHCATVVCAALVLTSPIVHAERDVAVRDAIFPNNRHTVADWSNLTFRRVALPKPDCRLRPSDCADIDVINTLDGFSTQPRVTVPFTGDIDPASVNSDTVYLVNLGDTLTLRGAGERVGINQVVWHGATRTLSFESDQLLAQHSRYLIVVTDGVRDAQGRRIQPGVALDQGSDAGARELRDALQGHRATRHRVVAASVFTTQSITADLQKIRAQLRRGTPAPVDFVIGRGAAGPVRTVFPTAGVADIQLRRQDSVAGALTPVPVPTIALGTVPGAVGHIAYGRYSSPDYQTAGKYIPATGSWTGQPRPMGSNKLTLQLFLPAGAKPAGGWPVAIFGHGYTDSIHEGPWTVAAVLASHGIATASINVVGHGGGARGVVDVIGSDGSVVTVPAGGRGIDQDGNGTIDATEGSDAAPPRNVIGTRDALRQTVIDLMQLVHQVRAGVDVDGDGSVDLDARRIYVTGQSFGGTYGTTLLAVEGDIRAGVPNVPGGSIVELARLSPVFRPVVALTLAMRTPQVLNLPPTPGVPFPFNLNFDENLPLRNLPPLVDSVPGAAEIQLVFDRFEWVQQAANPAAYAAHIRKQPLPGNAARPVLFQFAKGDMTTPNPASSAILRAGDFADRTLYFRNDLAYAMDPAVGKNPHTFLTNIGSAATAPYAVGAQQQIAAFFASDGALVIDPDGAAGPMFEVPIAGALPEVLNFIP